MSFDAVYAKNARGNWVFKAMNQNALEKMGEMVGGPWRIAKEVFWECGEARFEEYIQVLCRLGLTSGPALAGTVMTRKSEPPKPKGVTDEQLKALTEF